MKDLKPSHTSNIRSEPFSRSLLKMAIVLLIIQLLFVNTSCKKSQKNPLSSILIEWMAQHLMKPTPDSILLDDLFNEHKQILIQTLIVRDFRNEKKQSNDANKVQTGQNTTQPNDQEPLVKVLFQKNRTLLLQSDYLQMAKDKFAFTIPISLTEEFVKSRNLLHTFVALLYHVKVGTQNIVFYYEMFPLIKVWRRTVSQGLEIPFFADEDLLKERDHQAKLVSNVDIYLFHVNNILPFQSFEETEEIKFFTRNSDNSVFYFCTPVSKQITQQFEENYITLESLHEDLVYRIRFQIKVRPGYYPLIPTIYERGQKLTSNRSQTNESVDSHLNGPTEAVQTSSPAKTTSVGSSSSKVPQKTFDKFFQQWQLGQQDVPQHIKLIFSILPKYIKKVLYDGSVPLLLFIGWQIMIYFTFSFAIILCLIFQIRLYRNAEKFRGMTYWGLWIYFMASLMIYFAHGWYFEEENNISYLFFALYLWWKMRKIAILEFSLSYPFIKLNRKQWYTPYQSKDFKALKIMVIPTLLFTAAFLLYPIIFQNYLDSAKHFQRTFSLQQYILKRFILLISKYSLCLYLMVQVILNYMIKSCNCINWKIFILLSNLFLVDNIPVPVAASVFEAIYYLKQQILWTVLIIQKIHYGSNFNYLPSKNNEDKPGQNKSSSDNKLSQQSIEEKQGMKNDQLKEKKEQGNKSSQKQQAEQVKIVEQQIKMVREQTELKQNDNQQIQQQASALPGLATRHHSDIEASPQCQLTKHINKLQINVDYKENDDIQNQKIDETVNIHNCLQQNQKNKNKSKDA